MKACWKWMLNQLSDSTSNLCNLPHFLRVWFCWWVMTFALIYQLFHCPNETHDFFYALRLLQSCCCFVKAGPKQLHSMYRLAKMSVIFVTPSFVCKASCPWPVFYLMWIDTCTSRLVCDLCVYILHFIIPSGDFSVPGRKPSQCRHWFIC